MSQVCPGPSTELGPGAAYSSDPPLYSPVHWWFWMLSSFKIHRFDYSKFLGVIILQEPIMTLIIWTLRWLNDRGGGGLHNEWRNSTHTQQQNGPHVSQSTVEMTRLQSPGFTQCPKVQINLNDLWPTTMPLHTVTVATDLCPMFDSCCCRWNPSLGPQRSFKAWRIGVTCAPSRSSFQDVLDLCLLISGFSEVS